MWERLRILLTNTAPDDPAVARERVITAALALLMELAAVDGEHSDAETAAALALAQARFGLPAERAQDLVRAANDDARVATDSFRFTALINDHFRLEEKRAVIAALWSLAQADGRLSRDEDHYVRRIADLLYVPRADVVAAKDAALTGNVHGEIAAR